MSKISSDDTVFAPLPKAALVTGAAHRIGRSIVLSLASDGWAVAVHYNSSRAQAEEMVDEITLAGGRAVALAADLTDEGETADLVLQAVATLGPLGCLVNNASQFEADDPATATRESWDTHMEVNLRAPFVLTQGFAAQMPADASGCVVNIIDQRVWNLTPFFTTYTLSKAGLWTLTKTLAQALAPRIRVNAIGPGPTLASARQTDSQFNRQWQSTPLQRYTPTEEICAAVRFILSAPAMTGQMVALDGGQHLGWAQLDCDYLPEE